MTVFQGPTSLQKNVADLNTAGQSVDALHRAYASIMPLLAAGEQIEHLLIQNMAALKVFPGILALTNRRVMFLDQGLLKRSFRDLFWRDLEDAHLVEGLMGATLGFQSTDGTVLSLAYLPKEAARPAYAYAQQIEELALEYRRNRSMEEARAAARGVPVERFPEQQPLSVPPAAPMATLAPEEALGQLNALHDKGLLTDTEYQAKKTEILARL